MAIKNLILSTLFTFTISVDALIILAFNRSGSFLTHQKIEFSDIECEALGIDHEVSGLTIHATQEELAALKKCAQEALKKDFKITAYLQNSKEFFDLYQIFSTLNVRKDFIDIAQEVYQEKKRAYQRTF